VNAFDFEAVAREMMRLIVLTGFACCLWGAL
jgi:hypothetical protein